MCCNEHGRGVAYVFFHAAGASDTPQCNIQTAEATGPSWEEAASSMCSTLSGMGLRRQQVVSIDAHSDGPVAAGCVNHPHTPGTPACFSAHWHGTVAAGVNADRENSDAPVKIAYRRIEGPQFAPGEARDWTRRCTAAADLCRDLQTCDLCSITHSCDNNATFVFYCE
jgi:hypothetical protein